MTIAPFYVSHRPERVLLGCASGTTAPSVETAPLYGGAAHPEQRLLGLGLGGAIAVRVGLLPAEQPLSLDIEASFAFFEVLPASLPAFLSPA